MACFGLEAIGIVCLLVATFHVPDLSLFAWLGIFPPRGAVVFFRGWIAEKEGRMLTQGGGH